MEPKEEIRLYHETADSLAAALSDTQKLLEILRLGRPRDGKICRQYDTNQKILAEWNKLKALND